MFDSTVLQKLLGSAWYSSRKIEEELGFRPTRDLTDGVEEMVKEVQRNPETRLGGALR
jgi:nucleoside-diphosphate-sugar epimerase